MIYCGKKQGFWEGMMAQFREYNQKQGIFRTITPEELLEEEHPARIIDKVIEHLDLSELYARYHEEGAPAYHPKMMLKILFYSYMKGFMSCREMWEGLKNRADYIYLSGDQVPDFRTINRFRLEVGEVLPELFSKIVHVSVTLGLVDFKYLGIDGQKIQGNASFMQGKNKERYKRSVERVKTGIEKLLGREETEYFSEEMRQKRLKSLAKQEAKLKRFEAAIEALGETENVNLTDPEAKHMKHKDGRTVPSYNHQSAVDGKHGITVGVETRDTAFDHGDHLFPLVEQAEKNTGGRFEKVLADSGFCDMNTLRGVEKREALEGEKYFLPDRDIGRKEKESGKFSQSMFKRKETGEIRCPAGRVMVQTGTIRRNDGIEVELYRGDGCDRCELKEKCTSGKKRSIGIDPRWELREGMRERLRSDRGKEIYRKRQGIAEPVHGNDQKNLGWRQHHLRGIKKARMEFLLIRIGCNLKKIITYGGLQALQLQPV